MPAGLGADLGKGLQRRAKFIHVGQACTAKVAQRQGNFGMPHQGLGGFVKPIKWAGAVRKLHAQGTRGHLLKAQGQGAFHSPRRHGLAGQIQGRRTRGAVVVDIDDGNARHAHLVQSALAGRGVAVHITHIGLLHIGVAQAGIVQGQAHRLRSHHRIGLRRTGFGKGHHAHAHHEN